jgi:hypothetical protein
MREKKSLFEVESPLAQQKPSGLGYWGSWGGCGGWKGEEEEGGNIRWARGGGNQAQAQIRGQSFHPSNKNKIKFDPSLTCRCRSRESPKPAMRMNEKYWS